MTLKTLEAAADSLDDGSLTIAKEVTILAIAAHDWDHYHYVAFPLLISGTNKSEDNIKQAMWMGTAMDVWDESPYCAALYGDLWSVRSDGNATRHCALHQLLMSRTLSMRMDGDLFTLLSLLHGLNLQCGARARTLTIDYKHKFKSKSSLKARVCYVPAYCRTF